ncbi:hypothetical protein DPMN_021944 [Dreissena polymorpha]|uniref:B box-type domain-containing protein n=1 Tax=Dreissena polymorpha TaxID=45954 RepID=A0A9D4S9M7_DREPO|nr:hypothetical protein DPMN_021944 [Dreissena polymorpha]
MKKLTTCSNHQSEEVVYICVDEDQLCCIQCANTKHRHCRQLETIEQCLRDGLVKNNLQRVPTQNLNAARRHNFGYNTEQVHMHRWGEFYRPGVNIDQVRTQYESCECQSCGKKIGL